MADSGAKMAGQRALHWLQHFAERAAMNTMGDQPAGDPFGLEALLARLLPTVSAEFHGGVARIEGTLAGTQATPKVLLLGAYRLPTPGPWHPNGDGSGLALVMALIESLASVPPLHDTHVVLLGAPYAPVETDRLTPLRALAERAASEGLGVLVPFQVAGIGASFDVDVRTLATPPGAALLGEVFLLGRALGLAPFSGGAETAFPGPHVPFLERRVPALAIADSKDLLAGTAEDTFDRCDPAALEAAADVLLRYLCGERVV